MVRFFSQDYEVFGPAAVTAIAGPEMAEFMVIPCDE